MKLRMATRQKIDGILAAIADGPKLGRDFGLSGIDIRRLLSVCPQVEIHSFVIRLGRHGGKRWGFIKNGMRGRPVVLVCLKEDPRLPAFVASLVPWRISEPKQAQAVFQQLSPELGPDRARQIVQLLGYEYRSARLTACRADHAWRPRAAATSTAAGITNSKRGDSPED